MTAPATKPNAIRVKPDGIPDELKQWPQWVVWRYEWIDDKWTKPPRCARGGRLARANDPTTWDTYENAIQAYLSGDWDGIGFCSREEDPFVFVDHDNCIGGDPPQQLDPETEQLIRDVTYAELSPSTRGIRQIFKGSLPSKGRHPDSFGIFDRKHYMTITGAKLKMAPARIADDQARVDKLYERARKRHEDGKGSPNGEDPRDQGPTRRKYRPGERGGRLRELFGKLNSEGCGFEVIVQVVLDENERWFDPPKTEQQIRDELQQQWDQYHGQNGQGPAKRGGTIGSPEQEQSPDGDSEPYALPLREFIACKSTTPTVLVGNERETLLPKGGLLLLVGKGGKGKTTFTVDAAFHLASGIEWLGFAVPRPLRILFVENEGPQEQFRAKLERKFASWPHELSGEIFVKTVNWGAFAADQPAQRASLRRFLEANSVDLVVGDPLATLGIRGVGSPDDVRTFVDHLVDIGLTRDIAFWLLHHPRKGESEDELDEASGDWGGKPDTALRLAKLEGNRARLSFTKIRWASQSRPANILGFDPEPETFTVVGTEQAEERDYLADLVQLLSDMQARTLKEIACPKEQGGLGANDRNIRPLLLNNPDIFTTVNGKHLTPPRPPQGTYWTLVNPPVAGPDEDI